MLGVDPELPGIVPQLLFGVVPGFVVPFGFTLDPGVVLPGVEVGLFDPGAVVLGVPLGEVEPGVVEPGVVCPGVVCLGVVCPGVVAFGDCPACGVAVPAGGVAVDPGGVAGLACGVAGEPGVLWPAALPVEPPAGAVPPDELCATAQLPRPSTTANNIIFGDDIFIASRAMDFSFFVPS